MLIIDFCRKKIAILGAHFPPSPSFTSSKYFSSNQTEVLFVHFNENPAGHIAPIPDLTLPPFVQNYFDVQVHGDHAGESTLTLNASTTNPLNSTGVKYVIVIDSVYRVLFFCMLKLCCSCVELKII